MIEIIPAVTFKTLPWKNGKGETIELAINDNATLDSFEWRLSMATVSEDGVFSDFSGYERNLVLIEGESIHLTHDNQQTEKLTQLLHVAHFDGGCVTEGMLPAGTIKDFNIITAKEKCQTIVETFTKSIEKDLNFSGLVFAYSLADNITLKGDIERTVPQGDLLKLNNPTNISIHSSSLILVFIHLK